MYGPHRGLSLSLLGAEACKIMGSDKISACLSHLVNVQPKVAKMSIKPFGRYVYFSENNSFKTIPIDNDGENMLRTVFRNGELLIEDKFSYIKDRTLNYSSR